MTTIQKMRMQGFKSFAKLTEVVFPKGYSCIIGSNGSGKSNICDSICFVLGKSSAKELRAEKTANLIYNGGKNSNPAKEALVDIYFDNKNNEFPIKEENVKVTRVVRPSGQSIYKLNDKVVTRQQIVDLLNSAFIDPDGHNIILQGDIIRFAEMKTDDRRKIIEDIAGISVYEDKKEKSLRELDKVELKLNEAEIILTERSANLRELKKDRDQAIKYKQLGQDIKNNKASLIHLQIENRNSKKNELEEKITKEEDEIKKIQEKINEHRTEITKIKNDIKEITSEMEVKGEKEQLEIRRNIEDLKTNIARTEERINICKNELEKLNARSKQIKSDSQETGKKIKDLKEEKINIEKNIVTLADKNATLARQINTSKSKINPGTFFMDRSINFVIEHNDKNVYGTVGDLTTVDPEYALAIEVAAGNRIKSIVVEDDQTAAKYIRALKEKKIGTVTFLPLNKIHPVAIGTEVRELSKKTNGLAIDLVKYDSKFKNIFSYVFGSTVIVEDIEQARKIGIGSVRMATIEGDLVETSGAMIGGYRVAGNLGKTKASVKETVDVDALEAEHRQNESRMFELRAEIRNINLQIENMFMPETNKSEKILKEQDKEKEQFTKELKELQDMLNSNKISLKEFIDKENKFHNNFKDLGTKRGKFSEQIQVVETKIIKEDERVRAIENSINVYNINKAKIIGELEGLEKEFEEFKDGVIKKTISIDELTLRIREDERELTKIGNVNLRALEIYENIEKEYNELLTKKDKLKEEKEDVMKMINEIEQKKTGLFMESFNAVNSHFKEIFSSLSTKGSAHLELEDPENPLTSGVDIKVKIIGNKFIDIKSLSGGEKTLTALAFIFSIQEFKPASFYLLDEVDAALDKTNSSLLSELISKYSSKAQYILISHNDNMISKADQIYGITMQEGVSKIVSLKV
ncbi:MAG: chromosome segregation SMC family protein [Candidatus Nanoarchaeia archaeon]|nr:chromosome segregation SMC family protein [Candidatus Nanoarchaeia archaeon]